MSDKPKEHRYVKVELFFFLDPELDLGKCEDIKELVIEGIHDGGLDPVFLEGSATPLTEDEWDRCRSK